MADLKISELPDGGQPQDTDQIPQARGVGNFKLVWSNIRAWIEARFAPLAHVSDTGNPHAVTAAQANAVPDVLSLDGELLSHDSVSYTKIGVGADGEVLTARPGAAQGLKVAWDALPPIPAGTYNEAEKDGVSQSVSRAKLDFRDTGDAAVTVTDDAANDRTIVTIDATGGGEANTSSNAGAGEGLALPKSGVDLPFKSLTAGTNITLTPSADAIQISAASGGGSVNNPPSVKGDLWTFHSADTQRFPVGANGLSLVADSAQTAGLAWAQRVAESRAVNTQYSIEGGGDLSQDRAINLVGDQLTPGNNAVYGTNAVGTRLWRTGLFPHSSAVIGEVGYPFTPSLVTGGIATPNPAINFAYQCTTTGALTIDLVDFTQNGGQSVLSLESTVTATAFTNGTPVEIGQDPATGNRLLTLVKIAAVIYAFWGPSG